MDSRFSNYDNKTIEELEKEKEYLEEELSFSENIVKTGKSNERTSEAYNDIKFYEESLEYINNLIASKREGTKSL